jgi:hypothetical protein
MKSNPIKFRLSDGSFLTVNEAFLDKRNIHRLLRQTLRKRFLLYPDIKPEVLWAAPHKINAKPPVKQRVRTW